MSTEVLGNRVLRDIMDHLNRPPEARDVDEVLAMPTSSPPPFPHPLVPAPTPLGRHCWHFSGFNSVALVGSATITQEVCCFCGTRRSTKLRHTKGHGRYFPPVFQGDYDYERGVDPESCPHHKD